jgi:uncharacterized protein YfiM (DUF2279 family)
VVGIHEDVRKALHGFSIRIRLGISKEVFDGLTVGDFAEFQVKA